MLCWGWNLAQAPPRRLTTRSFNVVTSIVSSSVTMEQANVWASTGRGGSFRACDLRSPVAQFRGLDTGERSSSSSTETASSSSQTLADWPAISTPQPSPPLAQTDDNLAHTHGVTAESNPGTSSGGADLWVLKGHLDSSHPAHQLPRPQPCGDGSSSSHVPAEFLQTGGCAAARSKQERLTGGSEQPHRKRPRKSWEPRQHVSAEELTDQDDEERQLMCEITTATTSLQIRLLLDAPRVPLNTRHLSAMMHHLAVLHISQRRQRLTAEEAETVKLLLEMIRQDEIWYSSSLGPWELTTVLWAIVKLGYPCGKLFVTQALALAKRRFRYYTAQGLAELLWVVAKSGMSKLRPDWAKDYCQALRREAGSLSPQGVAMVLYSMAELGYTPSDTTRIRLLNRLLSLLLDGLCKPADVSMSLWGFGHFLPHQPANASLLEVIHSAQPLLPLFSAQELSNCIWGIAKLQLTPDATWMDAFYAASMAHLPTAAPQALSNILYALALLHLRPPQHWMQLYVLRVTHTLYTFTLQGLAVVVYAMGLVAYHPGLKWLQYFHAQLDRFEDSMDPKTTDMISSAYQRLKFSPQALLSSTSRGAPALQLTPEPSRSIEQLRVATGNSIGLKQSSSSLDLVHADELVKPSRRTLVSPRIF